MENFYRGGRGLCLPDAVTRLIAILRKKQRRLTLTKAKEVIYGR